MLLMLLLLQLMLLLLLSKFLLTLVLVGGIDFLFVSGFKADFFLNKSITNFSYAPKLCRFVIEH